MELKLSRAVQCFFVDSTGMGTIVIRLSLLLGVLRERWYKLWVSYGLPTLMLPVSAVGCWLLNRNKASSSQFSLDLVIILGQHVQFTVTFVQCLEKQAAVIYIPTNTCWAGNCFNLNTYKEKKKAWCFMLQVMLDFVFISRVNAEQSIMGGQWKLHTQNTLNTNIIIYSLCCAKRNVVPFDKIEDWNCLTE